MPHPSDYTLIRKWHEMTGSQPYYWTNLQEKAAKENAPVNAIYYDRGAERWRTADDVRAAAPRSRLGLPELPLEERPVSEQIGIFNKAQAPKVFFEEDPYTPGHSNATRAGFAARALASYARETNDDEDVETLLVDFMSDLRHLCDGHGLDFAELDRRGYNQYVEEASPSRFKKEE
jgi:hypothetical protein